MHGLKNFNLSWAVLVSEHSAPAPVAGNHVALSQRYVGALYTLAEQDGVLDVVAEEMRALRCLWNESAEWRFVACDPRLNAVSVREAVAQIIKISGLSKLTANFLSVVAQHHRLSLLSSLADLFLEEVATRRGEHFAQVRVARPLSAAQNSALLASLTAIAGGKTHLTVVEDASLLGGMTVKLGAKFIDASVKTKLNRLERTLKGAGAVA